MIIINNNKHEKYNTEKYNTENNPNLNPNHCYSSFLLPVIKWFFSFEKKTQKIQHAQNKFIQHSDTAHKPRSNTAQNVYNTFIQHADTACKYQEDAHIKRDPFCFQFKKSAKEVSSDAPRLLVWINFFWWKTWKEGRALVNASHPSLRNTMSSYNAVYSRTADFIARKQSRGHQRTPVNKLEFLDPPSTIRPSGTHLPGGNRRNIQLKV